MHTFMGVIPIELKGGLILSRHAQGCTVILAILTKEAIFTTLANPHGSKLFKTHTHFEIIITLVKLFQAKMLIKISSLFCILV